MFITNNICTVSFAVEAQNAIFSAGVSSADYITHSHIYKYTFFVVLHNQEYQSTGGGHSATQANFYAQNRPGQTPTYYLHCIRMKTFVENDGVLVPLVVESVGILDSVKWKGSKGPEMLRSHIASLLEWIEESFPTVIEFNNLMLVSDNSCK